MRNIYFHEDDYCQIELLPKDNLNHCLKQVEERSSASNDHWTGAGWERLHIRPEAPRSLLELNINLNRVRAAFMDFAPEYATVTTGYSSYQEPCLNTYAFGHTNEAALFVQIHNDVIKTAWCSDLSLNWQKTPCSEELIVVDWGWGFVSLLSDTARLQSYLDERDKAFKSAQK